MTELLAPGLRSARGEPRDDALAGSLGVMLLVWTLLALGAPLGPWLGRDVALFVSFAAAAALLLAIRPASSKGAPVPSAVVAAFLAGFASYPAWILGIASIGIAISLPMRLAAPPGAGSPLFWVAVVLCAPLFEELLYRERLLPALRSRFGSPVSIVLSSLLFALPHLEPWNVLGTFAVGLLLGSVYVRTRSTALCVAYHAGLNGACLVSGVPPPNPILDPLPSAIAGGALLALSILRTRSGGPLSTPHRSVVLGRCSRADSETVASSGA